MKNKSAFAQMLLIIILALVCLVATVIIALLAGSVQTAIFDFSNLNFANLIPMLFIGVFISCVVVGIAILFFGRTLFLKQKIILIKTKTEEIKNEMYQASGN